MSLSPKNAHVAVSILGVKGHINYITKVCGYAPSSGETYPTGRRLGVPQTLL